MIRRAFLLSGILLVGAGTGALIAYGSADEDARPRRTPPPSSSDSSVAADETRLRGRVLDSFDAPVRNGAVHCVAAPRTARIHPSRRDVHTSRTDHDGRFEIVVPALDRPHVIAIEHPQFPVSLAPRRPHCIGGRSVDLGDISLRSCGGIAVTVRREVDGQAVVGARVQARPEVLPTHLPAEIRHLFERSAETDDRGLAVLDGMRAGDFALRVDADGHASRIRHIEHGDSQVIAVEMAEGHILRGSVASADGTPIDRARLRITSLTSRIQHESSTRSTGSFRIPRLAAGPHVLVVDAEPHGTATIPDLEIPHPGPLAIRLPAPSALRGVATFAGEPVGDVILRMSRAEDPSTAIANGRTDATGTFVIPGIPPGRFHLSAASEAANLRYVTVVDMPCALLRLELLEARFFRGRLVSPDDEPIGGVRVSIMHPSQHAEFRQFELDARRVDAGARTDSDGRFQLDVTEPASRSDRLQVVFERSGAIEVHPVDLPATDTLEPVRFRWTTQPSVFGRVVRRDGTPAADRVVALIVRSQGEIQQRVRVRTDDFGTFRFASVQPGRYELGIDDADGRWTPSATVVVPDDATREHELTIR